AYDYGNYPEALSILESYTNKSDTENPALALFKGDVLIDGGDYESAAGIYKAIIEEFPRYSWEPYVNLAWLGEEKGLTEKEPDINILKYLIQAGDYFPEKKEVVLPLALFFIEQERYDEARQELDTYLAVNRKDPDTGLMYLQVQGAYQNPARYTAALWDLFNRNPENRIIGRYFGWYLLGLNDFGSLNILLKSSEESQGKEGWILFYRGVMEALTGNTETAIELLQQSYEAQPLWTTLYNLARLYLLNGSYETAIEYLRQADTLYISKSRDLKKNPERADILIQIANAMYLLGKIEDAKRDLKYALDADPADIEGTLLMKKLEGEDKK
ncbi:MAG: tetratricopeptide repeat protein, partial [Spirochaetota bacterium]